MSISAYPVFNNRMGTLSFNLSSDGDLADFLDHEIGIQGSILEGTGIVNIPMEILELAAVKSKALKISEKTKNRLFADIEYTKKHKQEVINYYCF